jgi:putative FmdB family regulatory protein
MPRYRYYCEQCEQEFLTFHGINDVVNICALCESQDTITKLLSTPIMLKKNKEKIDSQPVGKLTKDYIEINKEVLEEEKQKAKEKTHEPT